MVVVKEVCVPLADMEEAKWVIAAWDLNQDGTLTARPSPLVKVRNS